ncbi:type II toxin-antitoxin system Phd/YefM family antitoxin [Geodermatophilus sp. SYSU D00696]
MTTLSLADAKAHLSKLVARVSGRHGCVYVTVHGKSSAVLLAIEDLESLEETTRSSPTPMTCGVGAPLRPSSPAERPRAAMSWTRPWSALRSG